MRRNLLAVLVGVALAGGACAPTEEPAVEEATTQEAAQADAEAVRALIDAYVAAENAGDVERMLALTTDDLWIAPPDEPPIETKEALRSWWEELYAEYTLQGSVSNVETRASGDWGFARGTWDVTLTPIEGGEPQPGSYSFIVAARRDADGTWKATSAVWNRNTPAR